MCVFSVIQIQVWVVYDINKSRGNDGFTYLKSVLRQNFNLRKFQNNGSRPYS